MPPLTRRRLLIAISLVVLLLVAVVVVLISFGQDLKTRSALISVGMHSERVEGILSRPVFVLKRAAGKGAAFIWTDLLWQVDVLTDPSGWVESLGCVPSDSLYQRTMGRLIAFPK